MRKDAPHSRNSGASYQGKKIPACRPLHAWNLAVTESADVSRSARLVRTIGSNKKPIVEQKLEYADSLLDEIQLYALAKPVDEAGRKKRAIILLPSELQIDHHIQSMR